jgi:tRNA(Arg) A34 adenosine deaminase TadA
MRENMADEKIYQAISADPDKWIELACSLAETSSKHGGGPFGAVVVQIDDQTGEIIRYWTGTNSVVQSHDPTAHAEIQVIRDACRELKVFNLDVIRENDSRLPQPGPTSHCEIYCSCEPCPMCYAAIRWARIPVLNFAASRFDAAHAGFSDLSIYEELSLPYAQRDLKVRQMKPANQQNAFSFWNRNTKRSEY